MIQYAKRALVTVALVITTSCSGLMVSHTPAPALPETLYIAHTVDTYPLVSQITNHTYQALAQVQFNLMSGQQSNLLNIDDQVSPFYLITHHRPAGIDTEFLWSAPLAQDALVLVVHPDNPIESLSIEQVRRVYRGFETDWAGLSNYSENITVYSRENGSAMRLEFNRLVMGQQRTSPNARVLASSHLVVQQVATDRTGIGYLPYSLVDDTVKVVAIDGIVPTLATISANTYPLRLTIYLVGSAPPSSAYQSFIATIQGQTLEDPLSSIYAPLPR